MATTKKTVTQTSVKVEPKQYEYFNRARLTAPQYKAPTGKAPTYTVENFGEKYKAGQYKSKYMPQIEENLNKVTNWKYNPLEDANYQALAQVYGARGDLAAKNTLGDAAALNGGQQTSYAVSAAQQARNQYNQELASMIPQLEQAAYQRAQGTLGALMDMDNTQYGRFRDTEGDRWNQYQFRYGQFRDRQGDRQFKYNADYDKYRDTVGDAQWLYNANYQKYQDAVSQYQWAKNYNMDLYKLEQAEAEAASGGSGGGGGGGGGGGYGGYGGDIDLDEVIKKASEKEPENPHNGKVTISLKTPR